MFLNLFLSIKGGTPGRFGPDRQNARQMDAALLFLFFKINIATLASLVSVYLKKSKFTPTLARPFAEASAPEVLISFFFI